MLQLSLKLMIYLHDVTMDYYQPKHTKPISNAKVVGVLGLTSKRVCLSCIKGEIVEITDTPTYGRCTECPTTSLLPSCKLKTSATLKFKQKRDLF